MNSTIAAVITALVVSIIANLLTPSARRALTGIRSTARRRKEAKLEERILYVRAFGSSRTALIKVLLALVIISLLSALLGVGVLAAGIAWPRLPRGILAVLEGSLWCGAVAPLILGLNLYFLSLRSPEALADMEAELKALRSDTGDSPREGAQA